MKNFVQYLFFSLLLLAIKSQAQPWAPTIKTPFAYDKLRAVTKLMVPDTIALSAVDTNLIAVINGQMYNSYKDGSAAKWKKSGGDNLNFKEPLERVGDSVKVRKDTTDLWIAKAPGTDDVYFFSQPKGGQKDSIFGFKDKGATGIPSYNNGNDTTQIFWERNRTWFVETRDAANQQKAYHYMDSSSNKLASADSIVFRTLDGITAPKVKFRGMSNVSGDSLLVLDANGFVKQVHRTTAMPSSFTAGTFTTMGVASGTDYFTIEGRLVYNTEYYFMDADFNMVSGWTFGLYPIVNLQVTLSANRTLTLPVGKRQNEVLTIASYNDNASFHWNLAGSPMKMMNGTTVTQLTDGLFYELLWSDEDDVWYVRNIGGGVPGSGSGGSQPSNQIVYGTGTGTASESALSWNPTTDVLNISGTIATTSSTFDKAVFDDPNNTGYSQLRLRASTQSLIFGMSGSSASGAGALGPSSGFLGSTAAGGLNLYASNAAGDINFYTANTAAANLRGQIDQAGKWFMYNITRSSSQTDSSAVLNPTTGELTMRPIGTYTMKLANIGSSGVRIAHVSGDTTYFSRIKNSYAFTWNKGSDSAVTGTIDTTLMATRAWVLGQGYGTGGGGGSGTPPGSDKQMIFNDGGAYGADAGFEYNKTLNELTVDSINAKSISTDLLISGKTLNLNAGGLSTGYIAEFKDANIPEVVIYSLATTNGLPVLTFKSDFVSLANTENALGKIYGGANSTSGGAITIATAASSTGTMTDRAIFAHSGNVFTTTANNTFLFQGTGSNAMELGFLVQAERSSGATANDYGSGIGVGAENSTGTRRTIATFGAQYKDVTNASEDAYFILNTITNGTLTENYRVTNNTLTTTDATVTTIETIPIATGHRRHIDVVINGRDASGNEVFYHRIYRVKNISGTLTLVSTKTPVTDDEDAAVNASDVVGTISGTNFLIQINGPTGVTMTWNDTMINRKL